MHSAVESMSVNKVIPTILDNSYHTHLILFLAQFPFLFIMTLFLQGSGDTLEKHLFPTPSAHTYTLNTAVSFLQTHRQAWDPHMTNQLSSLHRDRFKNGHMPLMRASQSQVPDSGLTLFSESLRWKCKPRAYISQEESSCKEEFL